MARKRLRPIVWAQAAPDSIGRREQRSDFLKWTFASQYLRPSARAATGKNLACRLVWRKKVPVKEDIAHDGAFFPTSPLKKSPTRLPSTAVRYLAEERISSMGWISLATVAWQDSKRELLID
jgi:hypothetical protein